MTYAMLLQVSNLFQLSTVLILGLFLSSVAIILIRRLFLCGQNLWLYLKVAISSSFDACWYELCLMNYLAPHRNFKKKTFDLSRSISMKIMCTHSSNSYLHTSLHNDKPTSVSQYQARVSSVKSSPPVRLIPSSSFIFSFSDPRKWRHVASGPRTLLFAVRSPQLNDEDGRPTLTEEYSTRQSADEVRYDLLAHVKFLIHFLECIQSNLYLKYSK